MLIIDACNFGHYWIIECRRKIWDDEEKMENLHVSQNEKVYLGNSYSEFTQIDHNDKDDELTTKACGKEGLFIYFILLLGL